ncbi:CPBP family intramembrane glutamic endopeptidase [Algoriphagus sp. A40]|uniref:CPBP family intramembrane glutamic endopeptidase n=1 Tax=Algoriphagus sp. A40 TaxID=1945863 RepID=UPI000985E344|nr:CPBP family intramembrane glutamic endopeptidase [Algoriphagus sp. A40]OOG77284.1 CAAX protease family protein [Algoriphagus sp. A40]
MKNELKPIWNRFFQFNWKFGLFLILIVCIPRFLLVLNANETGNYNAIGMVMLISALAPFIFLSEYGRRKIGLSKPVGYRGLLIAFAAGLGASLLLFWIGEGLYGTSYENWYVYIGKSYNIPAGISPNDKQILFLIMALVGMTFSPIGEELFFRGIVHSSFANSIGEKYASVVDSSAFSLTHISHFGLVFIAGNWDFYTIPALIWVGAMFLVSLLFIQFKKQTGSILGAIICHSAFNLGMIYSIFYLL